MKRARGAERGHPEARHAAAGYRTPYGEDGYFQNHLRVYGRHGKPCPACGEPIERIRVTQRSTHFCPQCQPAGK